MCCGWSAVTLRPCALTLSPSHPCSPCPQELFHSSGLGGPAANVYWFDAGNNTFWAPKETLIAVRWGAHACLCVRVLMCARAANEGAATRGKSQSHQLCLVAGGRCGSGCVGMHAPCQPERPARCTPPPSPCSFLLFAWAESNRLQVGQAAPWLCSARTPGDLVGMCGLSCEV